MEIAQPNEEIHMTRRNPALVSLALLLAAALGPIGSERDAWADEGMWTFDNFPKQLVQRHYGFSPSDAWLDHIRLASVRFNNGGSGAFVSSEGLVMTNHHVGSDCIHELSSSTHDYMAEGFRSEEHTSELQSQSNLVCRLLLEKKKIAHLHRPPAVTAIDT